MLSFLQYAWLIPLLPFLAFVAITLTPLRKQNRVSAILATILIGAAMLVALGVLSEVAGGWRVDSNGALAQVPPQPIAEATGEQNEFRFLAPHIERTIRWAPAGDAAINLGFVIDPMIAIMLVMVSIAAFCIHLFSVGYMAEDARQARFFSFTALFTAAMLLMVMASNLLLLFIAWELMGLCSYLLIGFWYDRSYADPRQITPRRAAIKAFITTRIGDVLLMLGLCFLWFQAGTLEIGVGSGQVFNPGFLERIAREAGPLGMTTASAIALLLFCGTVGKSAQVPLHVWLPDAMEGPTPVSALIHAATMVAAGVFLIARTYPIFVASQVLPVVAAVGAFTALFAAVIAVGQFDIKRILAYSTLSQLGFMVAALGIGGWTAAIFHLLTHAFFKALLFLGAGSVIHGMYATVGNDPNRAQDIRNMGGLRRFMPITYWTYLAGYLALAGIAPLAGFWSKDEILAVSLQSGQPVILGALLLASLLTAFYMTRQLLLVFFGPFRSAVAVQYSHSEHNPHEGGAEPHESPRSMTIPLVILSIFAVGAGALNLPNAHWLSGFLGQPAHHFNPTAALLGTTMALLGMALGFVLYRRAFNAGEQRDPLELRIPTIFRWLNNRLYVDELYAVSIGRLVGMLTSMTVWFDSLINRGLAGVNSITTILGRINASLDEQILNGGADQLAQGTTASGNRVRRMETGKAQDYLALIFGGVIVLGAVALYVLRG